MLKTKTTNKKRSSDESQNASDQTIKKLNKKQKTQRSDEQLLAGLDSNRSQTFKVFCFGNFFLFHSLNGLNFNLNLIQTSLNV